MMDLDLRVLDLRLNLYLHTSCCRHNSRTRQIYFIAAFARLNWRRTINGGDVAASSWQRGGAGYGSRLRKHVAGECPGRKAIARSVWQRGSCQRWHDPASSPLGVIYDAKGDRRF